MAGKAESIDQINIDVDEIIERLYPGLLTLYLRYEPVHPFMGMGFDSRLKSTVLGLWLRDLALRENKNLIVSDSSGGTQYCWKCDSECCRYFVNVKREANKEFKWHVCDGIFRHSSSCKSTAKVPLDLIKFTALAALGSDNFGSTWSEFLRGSNLRQHMNDTRGNASASMRSFQEAATAVRKELGLPPLRRNIEIDAEIPNDDVNDEPSDLRAMEVDSRSCEETASYAAFSLSASMLSSSFNGKLVSAGAHKSGSTMRGQPPLKRKRNSVPASSDSVPTRQKSKRLPNHSMAVLPHVEVPLDLSVPTTAPPSIPRQASAGLESGILREVEKHSNEATGQSSSFDEAADTGIRTRLADEVSRQLSAESNIFNALEEVVDAEAIDSPGTAPPSSSGSPGVHTQHSIAELFVERSETEVRLFPASSSSTKDPTRHQSEVYTNTSITPQLTVGDSRSPNLSSNVEIDVEKSNDNGNDEPSDTERDLPSMEDSCSCEKTAADEIITTATIATAVGGRWPSEMSMDTNSDNFHIAVGEQQTEAVGGVDAVSDNEFVDELTDVVMFGGSQDITRLANQNETDSVSNSSSSTHVVCQGELTEHDLIPMGLRNYKNNCFANATLQALYSSSALVQYFVSGRYVRELHRLETDDSEDSLSALVTDCFQSMLLSAREGKNINCSLVLPILKVMGIDYKKTYDAEEFLSALVNLLCADVYRTKKAGGYYESYINDQLCIEIVQITACECTAQSVKQDPWLILRLYPPSWCSFELMSLFDVYKDGCDDNSNYPCETCQRRCPHEEDKRTTATTVRRLHNLPPFLCITLSRFVDLNTKNTQKLQNLHDCFQIDLKPFVWNCDCCDPLKPYRYRLVAVIVHDGKKLTDRGHYRTFARRQGRWYHFNDDKTPKAADGDDVALSVKMEQACILFYERCA